MEPERSDPNQRQAQVQEGIADRQTGLDCGICPPKSTDNARDVGKSVDKLGDIVAVRVVELAPVCGGELKSKTNTGGKSHSPIVLVTTTYQPSRFLSVMRWSNAPIVKC
jgi:hypothetical protein